jgi:endonuclease III
MRPFRRRQHHGKKQPMPRKPKSLWTADRLNEAFGIFAAANPEPQTELAFVNDYTLLVAVVLSAQATDVGVNRATKRLFEQVQTPQAMLDLGLDGLISHIKTIGLFNAKAKNVIALSKILVDDHDGQVPHDRDALEALPGVGRKTANVVLNIAFGDETCAVDTHIFRVANRTAIAPGKTPRAVEDGLMRVIPAPYRRHAHHWLILHGRYICKARSPDCARCSIAHLCPFPAQAATAKPRDKSLKIRSSTVQNKLLKPAQQKTAKRT